ncbi:MAG: hypothetical protein NUV76_10590 [Candidatus Kuenenia sp.]|nr:hypothetical protein [Candidatus Kuenenia sp.]
MHIPQNITIKFDPMLLRKGIPRSEHHNFRKWLRYYLDFCKKYGFPESKKESLPRFIKKLQEKHQSSQQQKQAAFAISLYYSIVMSNPEDNLLESENAQEKLQPSHKQKQTAQPFSRHDSIRQPETHDFIHDGKKSYPDFHKELQGEDQPVSLQKQSTQSVPNNHFIVPPVSVNSKKAIAFENAKGWTEAIHDRIPGTPYLIIFVNREASWH